ncbi:MAG: succinate dehydrogenase cytochrome b subunit [Bacteroidota bacterium]
MSKFFEFLNSSVGRKWLMALTGLFLCLFVVVHMSGNLQLFKNDQGKAFNEYAVFMTTFPPIKMVSYVNYFFILLHAANGFYLVLRNRKARPVKYEGKKSGNETTWSSKNMGLLGSILLVFIVIHMGHFWREFHFTSMPVKQYVTDLTTDSLVDVKAFPVEEFKKPMHITSQQYDIIVVKDLYAEVESAFKNPLYVAFYVIAMIALSYHLAHGFQSAFQTMGIRRKNYEKIIKSIGTIFFAIIIPALFAAMPLYFLFIKH